MLSASMPHAGGVELLGDGDKKDALTIQHLDDLGNIGERAGQAVALLDDDKVDPAGGDIGEESMQRWPVHAAAGEAAIVIASEQGQQEASAQR